MKIRTATTDDAQAILDIYSPYVSNTAITFEYDVPDISEFTERIENILKKYPYLVAIENDTVAGYAYAGEYRSRAAYQHCAEVSIYIDRNRTGRGTGRELYRLLEQMLLRQNVFILYACITESESADDPYVTDGSIRFHEKMGYSLVGKYYHCGYKFGKWFSMRIMEKITCQRPDTPHEFIPFMKLSAEVDKE